MSLSRVDVRPRHFLKNIMDLKGLICFFKRGKYTLINLLLGFTSILFGIALPHILQNIACRN